MSEPVRHRTLFPRLLAGTALARGLVLALWLLVQLVPRSALAAEADCASGAAAGCTKATLLIVAEPWAPYEFAGSDGRVQGIDIDLLHTIFARLERTVELRLEPWQRAWQMIERGEADAVLSTSKSAERDLHAYFPQEPMWQSSYVFFTPLSTLKPGFNGYATARALRLRIGIVAGNSYHPSFWAAFPYQDAGKTRLHEQLFAAKVLAPNLQKLAEHRLDLVPADVLVGRYTLKQLGLQNRVGWYEPPLFDKPYYLALSRARRKQADLVALAAEFDRELKALKANGEYAAIREQWLR